VSSKAVYKCCKIFCFSAYLLLGHLPSNMGSRQSEREVANCSFGSNPHLCENHMDNFITSLIRKITEIQGPEAHDSLA